MRALKHPRTMTEAFGPYTSNQISEPPAPFPWTKVWAAWAAAIAIIAGSIGLMAPSAGVWAWVGLAIGWMIVSCVVALFVGRCIRVGMGDDHA